MIDNGKICVWFQDGKLIEPLWDEDSEAVEYELTLNGLIESIQKRICEYHKAQYFVYFITDGNKVKIGRTNNVKQRINGLQTANALCLNVIAVIPCRDKWISRDIESDLHIYFQEYRTNGEWFDVLNNNDFLYIADLFSNSIKHIVIPCTLHISLLPGDEPAKNIIGGIKHYMAMRNIGIQFHNEIPDGCL